MLEKQKPISSAPARWRGSSPCGPKCGSAHPHQIVAGLGECVRLFTESGDEHAAAIALAGRATARLQFPDVDAAKAQAELTEAIEKFRESATAGPSRWLKWASAGFR